MSRTTKPEAALAKATRAAGQTTNGKTMRALNVPIPDEVYWHVRAMALQSRLPFKSYITRFLAEAWPYPPENPGRPTPEDKGH